MQNWGSVGAMRLDRRAMLAGLLVAGALTLPGGAALARMGEGAAGGRHADEKAVRRLMELSSDRAFAKLTQPDGFWNSTVARIDLPVLFARPGNRLEGPLRSPAFRETLQHELNKLAEAGAAKAAPRVAHVARSLAVHDAGAILHGTSNTAATTYLRQAVGPALVNAMIPALQQEMIASRNPVLMQAVAALKGVDLTDAAHALALGADNAIWYQIGASEAEIRTDPSLGNDPALIAALRRP